MPTPQARYWLCTIPVSSGWTPVIRGNLCYLKGQQETGNTTGYTHYQVLAVTSRRVTQRQLKDDLCNVAHVEPSRSSAANGYVWKDDTAVPGTRFELGALPTSKARSADWDKIYADAVAGDFDSIPKDVLIRNYSSIKRIRVDNCRPPFRPDVKVFVYWGPTGTGKTHRCFQEAGDSFYVKNSRTKWWDGYQGQSNVIIDEFAGAIDVTYLLNWFDKYPCFAEVKGFSVPLQAVNFWVTSNIEPIFWYSDISPAHRDALLRRLTRVEKMETPFNPNHLTPSGSPVRANPNPPTPNPNRVLNFNLEDLLS